MMSAPLLDGKAEPLVVTGGMMEPLGLGKIPLLEAPTTLGAAYELDHATEGEEYTAINFFKG
jgi:hypothetical protein